MNSLKPQRLGILAAILLLPVFALAEETPVATANATNQFVIKGMSCDGCARGIASELRRVPGVASAEVTLSNNLAVVAYDTNRVSTQALKQAIVEAGYEAKLVKPPKPKRL